MTVSAALRVTAPVLQEHESVTLLVVCNGGECASALAGCDCHQREGLARAGSGAWHCGLVPRTIGADHRLASLHLAGRADSQPNGLTVWAVRDLGRVATGSPASRFRGDRKS